MSAQTRRTLLGASAAAALTGTVATAASPHPDVELLAALAEFDALEHQIFPKPAPATIAEEDVWMVWAEPLMVRRRACLDRLCDMETHTLEGFRARLRSLLAFDDLFMPELEADAAAGYWPQRMLLALLRGLAGERVT